MIDHNQLQKDVDDILENNERIRKIAEDDNKIIVYKIRINYKSKNSIEFWVSKIEYVNNKWTWSEIDTCNSPILLGVDHIESVFTVGIAFIDKEKI